MRLISIFLTLFLLSPSSSFAQNMVAKPIDEAATDPSFFAYRTALIKAVKARDTEAVVNASSPDIALSFGTDKGHDDLRDILNVPVEKLSDEYKSQAPRMRDAIWEALDTLLNLGGSFQDNEFSAPYTWNADVPKDAEPYETYFVTGQNVLMRTQPNRDSAILRRLSYNIVYVNNWVQNSEYQAISLPDDTKGFLSQKYLRSQVDYRAIFTKENGLWKMIIFMAGD